MDPRDPCSVARWTDFVGHRKRILAVWLVLFVLGGFGAANLGGLLSNRFSVPGVGVRARARRCSRTAWASAPTARSRSSRAASDAPAERAAVAAAARARGRGASRAARPGRCCRPRRDVVYVADRDAAREPGRVEGDAGAARARSATVPGVADLPVRLSRRSTTTPRRSSTRTSARGESIAVPIALLVHGVHVRHARRDRRARSLFALDDDPDDARARLDLRPHDGHGDLRDEHRHADRLRDRGRLLDARRLPLPRGARATPTTRTTRCATTMATAGRATLFSGPDRRGRARAARLHAAAVHALDGRRRPARAARLDRRVGDASCPRCWR